MSVRSETWYVGIDHQMHTAYIYDENFGRFPENPNISGTSIIQFQDTPRWLLGYNVDVVRRHGNSEVEVVSNEPAYYEMVHHFVMTYVSSGRPNVDRCTHRPIATGSELTDIWFPTGYGYKMVGGALVVATSHWDHTMDVPHEEQVYLRFIVIFDDQDGGYNDTHLTWVGTAPTTSCNNEFAIPPGESEFQGPLVEAPRDMRIVAVYTHTHDHSEYIELRHNDKALRRFIPDYTVAAALHHDVGQGAIPLHVQEGHLPPQGLSHSWMPGAYGPIVKKGDALTAFGKFNNPHDRSIDNMVIFGVLWEEIT
jgi:hypothetical protein